MSGLDAAYGVNELHREIERLRGENRRLRAENARLQSWVLSPRNSPLDPSNQVPFFKPPWWRRLLGRLRRRR